MVLLLGVRKTHLLYLKFGTHRLTVQQSSESCANRPITSGKPDPNSFQSNDYTFIVV